jgi:tetratricopeptide (TPR) repeat protein
VEKGLALLPPTPGYLRVSAFTNLGLVHYYKGELAPAVDHTEQSLAVSRQLQDHYRSILTLGNLCVFKFIAGDWPGALADSQQALALAEQLGSSLERTRLNVNLGVMYTKMGRFDAARQHLETSRRLAVAFNLREYQVLSLSSLADIAIRRQDALHAAGLLQEAEGLVQTMEAEWQLPEIHRLWGETKLLQGEAAAAFDHAQRAVEIAQRLGMALEEGTSQRVMGQARLACGEHELADQAFDRSLTLLDHTDNYEAARTRLVWGRAQVEAGRVEQGRALLAQARTVFEQLGAEAELRTVR